MSDLPNLLFPLGQVLSTPGALQAMEDSGEPAIAFLERHARGDWGDVGQEDGRLNDKAVVEGSRILSSYATRLGVKLWVITEAADEQGERAATTLLLPEEY